jgi:Mg-chelatase subunit ChlD
MGTAISRVARTASVLLLAVIMVLVWVSAARRVASAAEVAGFRISQAVTDPPKVIAYLEILDQANNLAPISREQLGAALGSSGATLEGLARFREQGEGVAYILLVDISKSLKEKEFAQMRQVLTDWSDMMTAKDQAGIITFGTEVRQALDFTSDKDTLKTVVSQLKPTDMQTQLHLGLIKALEMGRRIDPNLPRRRAIITLSDGEDDFAGGATKQEVLDRLKVDPVPIYAIGFYSGPKKSAKEELLKNLGEFARTSGGSYFRAEADKFSQVYDQIWQRINEVYVATLDCSKAQWDGAVRHLQFDLAAGPQAVRAGMDIRLSSWEVSTPPPPPSKPWWDFLPAWEIGDKVIPGWAYGGAILALFILGAALIILIYQRRRAAAQPEAYAAPSWESAGAGASGDPMMATNINFPKGAATGDATVPLGNAPLGAAAVRGPSSKGIKVRLTFVRSEASVAPLEFTLSRPIIIGRNKPPSDLAIPEDKEVSRKHCQLLLDDGAVKIVDLGSTNGTLVNGVPITGQFILKHDDIIRVGKTELRLAMLNREQA